MTEHSPLPWRLDNPQGGTLEVCTANNRRVFHLEPRTEEDEANLRLIVSAVNQAPLLKEVEGVIEEYHQGLAPNKQLPHNLCVICDLLLRVRQAVLPLEAP